MAKIKYKHDFDDDIIFNDNQRQLTINFDIKENDVESVEKSVLEKFDNAMLDKNIKYKKDEKLVDDLRDMISESFNSLKSDSDKLKEMEKEQKLHVENKSNWEFKIEAQFDSPEPKEKERKQRKNRP